MKFAHQSATIRQHGKGMIILETALETAGLTYVFPDGNGIKNIAFQVKRGEIYALYGGHHAGKSVLLQTIIGTLRPQAGTLKLFGNIDYQKERRRIGFVPQKPVTIGSLSPADMLRYFSSVFGTTEIHILDILHLNLKEKKAVRRLPLSTQRLVNLAVALLGNPDMIILDDPFSGLDKGECEHLLSVLTYLHEITNALNKAETENEQARLKGRLLAAAGLLGLLWQNPESWFKSGIANGGLDAASIEAKIAERVAAKKNKDYALADKIRNELKEQGIILEDTPSGTTWKKA